MEQNVEINDLQQLFDWIDDNSACCYVSEKDNDYFCIEASNNADVMVSIESDDNIRDIISRTVDVLLNFDADERFTELWSANFAKHNHFKPSQFITMLKDNEESYHNLAYQLLDYMKSLSYSKAV